MLHWDECTLNVLRRNQPLKNKPMNLQFDERQVKTRAIDKIYAALINSEFAVEDAKRDLYNGLYSGVTRNEQVLIFEGYKTDVRVYEYILNQLTKTTT